MMDISKEEKAKLALDSLLDSCEMLAELSGGMERKDGYDAYFVPETFWYNRVHLNGEVKGNTSSGLKETIDEISSRVRTGELPPLLSWNNDDYDKKEMRRLLSNAGYVPMVTQTLMYMPLKGRQPMSSPAQVDHIQPEEAENWSKMTAAAFGKPPETEGMKMLATHKDCDFLVWRESDVDGFVADNPAADGPVTDDSAVDGPDAGEMLGGTLLICKDGNAGIHEVSSMPEHRRKGIGAALVNRAFDIAVQKGCTYATLQASEMGYPLYLHLGMEEVGYVHNWIMPLDRGQ